VLQIGSRPACCQFSANHCKLGGVTEIFPPAFFVTRITLVALVVHTHTHTHTHTYTHTYTHAHSLTHTHTLLHTRTHTYTHMHAHTHTHTHTQTYTQAKHNTRLAQKREY